MGFGKVSMGSMMRRRPRLSSPSALSSKASASASKSVQSPVVSAFSKAVKTYAGCPHSMDSVSSTVSTTRHSRYPTVTHGSKGCGSIWMPIAKVRETQGQHAAAPLEIGHPVHHLENGLVNVSIRDGDAINQRLRAVEDVRRTGAI